MMSLCSMLEGERCCARREKRAGWQWEEVGTGEGVQVAF